MDRMQGMDSTKPRHMSYKLLDEITEGFSEANILGSGGFGVVYKGVAKDGQEIAVKVLHPYVGDLDGKIFCREFENISGLKHTNIVQLVGFCSEEEKVDTLHNGELVEAVRKRRALCFEYMHNRSLEEYISDEHHGLSWQERYRIIKGICEGLKYLHTGLASPICHLDLKPANILLDKNMTPKIADFGMSRLIGEDNTKRTVTQIGSKMYMPPEFMKYQLTSKEYDIYSLGVIIIMVMVGPTGYSLIADKELPDFFDGIYTKWRERLQGIPEYNSLEADCQQVKKCIDIASKCIEDKKIRRPSIVHIVDQLNQTEEHVRDLTSGTEEVSIDLSRRELTSSIGRLEPTRPVKGGNSMGRMRAMDSTEPRYMPYSLLKEITCNFSDDNLLGCGECGLVYKGVDRNGQEIAVKLLHDSVDLGDILFNQELNNIISLKHPNIIQFVGYCTTTEVVLIEHKGQRILVQRKFRALCFEYLPNGSLDLYISDEHQGLTWPSRYRIIQGICEGLKYLHTGQILHLDLKPQNILLDENMIPKISDFLLSRLIDEGNTNMTNSPIGTMGYMPPEYINHGIVSTQYDIFSLGVTIIKIVVGSRGFLLAHEMPPAEFVELVHMKWRQRLQEIPGYMSLEADCEQVKICIEIALKCIEMKRNQRPSIQMIVDQLCQTEKHKNDLSSGTEEMRPIISTELLDVYPQQLCFLMTPNKSISRSLHLTNKSHECVAVRLQSKGSKSYKMPLFGIVPPRSKCTLVVTTREQTKPSPNNESLILESIILREGDLNMKHTDADSAILQYKNIFKKARETDANNVHELMFPVICAPSGDATISSQPLLSEVEIISNDFANVLSVDVHLTKPWIMTSHYGGNVVIWNYKKQETMNVFKITTAPVYSTKFIHREQWLVAGDRNGTIYVYNYYCPEIESEVWSIEEAHDSYITSLDVHPTEPFMLSSSDDHLIKLWNWENRWKFARTFMGHSGGVTQVNFIPTEANHFASASMDHTIRIWDISSSESKMTLCCDRPDGLLCMRNYISNNRKYLISGFGDGSAQVWDVEEETCVQTFEGHLSRVSSVCSHPEHGVLITGSFDGTVRVWNSTTYRLANIIGVNLGAVYALGYIESIKRVVIGCYQGMAIVELNPELL